MSPNDPITKAFCDERFNHMNQRLESIEKGVQRINAKMDMLPALVQRMNNHEKGHDKAWSKSNIIITLLVAVATLVLGGIGAFIAVVNFVK